MWNNKQKCLINAVGAKPAFPQLLPVYAARFPTARTSISLILVFLWFLETALSIDMEGWKCQGIKTYHFPQIAISWWLPEAGVQLFQLPCPLSNVTLRFRFYTTSQSSPEQDSVLVAHHTDLFNNTLCVDFLPLPSHFFTPLPVFPGISLQTNHLHSNSCLRFYF